MAAVQFDSIYSTLKSKMVLTNSTPENNLLPIHK